MADASARCDYCGVPAILRINETWWCEDHIDAGFRQVARTVAVIAGASADLGERLAVRALEELTEARCDPPELTDSQRELAAENIRLVRAVQQLSVDEIAKRIGRPRSTLLRQLPRLDRATLMLIAGALGVEPEWLVMETPDCIDQYARNAHHPDWR